jgi:hypothetical protein
VSPSTKIFAPFSPEVQLVAGFSDERRRGYRGAIAVRFGQILIYQVGAGYGRGVDNRSWVANATISHAGQRRRACHTNQLVPGCRARRCCTLSAVSACSKILFTRFGTSPGTAKLRCKAKKSPGVAKSTDFGLLGRGRKVTLSCGSDRWLRSAPNTNSERCPVTAR